MPSAGLRRRLRIGVPGTLLVLLLSHQIWNAIERRRFEAAVELLRASGARLDQAEFADPIVPDEENAALLLQEAYAWLQTDAPRTALPEAKFRGSEAWSLEDRHEVLSWLTLIEPYFALLERAAAKPGWHVAVDVSDPYLARFEGIVWLNQARDALALRLLGGERADGWTSRAIETATLMLDLQDRARLPGLLGHLTRQHCWSDVRRFLGHAATEEGFDAAALRRGIEPRLLHDEARVGMQYRDLEFERAAQLWLHRRILAGESHSVVGDLLPGLARSWIARPWRYRDALATLELADLARRGLEGPPEEVPRLLETIDARESGLGPVSRLVLPVWRGALRRYVMEAAAFRLTRIVLALLERKQASGAWPETLEGLLDGGIPRDPISGVSFGYLHDAHGVRLHAAAPPWRSATDRESLESSGLAWSFPP